VTDGFKGSVGYWALDLAACLHSVVSCHLFRVSDFARKPQSIDYTVSQKCHYFVSCYNFDILEYFGNFGTNVTEKVSN